MARVNYKKIVDRFDDIDAEFVGCEIGFPSKDGYFTVDLYPWWEHPLIKQAQESGAVWSVTHRPDGASKHVTVYPQHTLEAKISRNSEILEWDFTTENPILWQYENKGEITSNGPITIEQWMEIAEVMPKELGRYRRLDDIHEYVDLRAIYRWGKFGSFSLGKLPRPLFLAVKRHFDQRSLPYYASPDPAVKEIPVIFLIDGDDYIIAQDFDVDVPEFEHKPEWFTLM